jgi:hypothetical protein
MNVPIVPGLIGSLLGWPFKEAAKVGLSATSAWIVLGAQAMLAELVKLLALVSTPSLTASWFSDSYWQIASLAMLLTVPFLFAAAVQAVIRTDLGVLLRAALIDLPIAVLAVTVTAPLVALLLAATDEMCAMVTGHGTAGGSFLAATSLDLTTIRSSAMLAIIAVMILLAGMVLMVELIMRSAAIYIVVLFLPIGFAAMVWPARRVWIKRMVELLLALILSKFAMVAILSLAVSGLASLSASPSAVPTALTAMALLVLAAFSPWALLRLLPFTEIAAGAGAMLHDSRHQGMERGARTAFNAAAVAADPATAGANALSHLVRNSATLDPNGATGDGLGPLRRASAPAGRSAGSGEPTGTVVPGENDAGGSVDVTARSEAGAPSSTAEPVAGFDEDDPPGPPAVEPAPAGASLARSDRITPVKGRVEDLSPIFGRDGREMSLSPGTLGQLLPRDDDATPDESGSPGEGR